MDQKSISRRGKTILGIVACAMLLSSPVFATDWTGPATAKSGTAKYTPAELDQILAPVALYPDELLGSILTAATYPLEVVEADRWLQKPDNRALKGDQLRAALDGQPWDATVKSLVSFPEILNMMDNNLQWTESLGDAFLADQAGVMDSVQRLRHDAQAAGRLSSDGRETVSTHDQDVVIQPASPEIVYVPCYSPFVVYGPWPWPAYPPYYFLGYDCAGPWLAYGIGFSIGPYWGWDLWDWPHRRLYVDVRRFGGVYPHRPPIAGAVWHHDYAHRRGVPYRGAAAAAALPSSRSLAPDALAQTDPRRASTGRAPDAYSGGSQQALSESSGRFVGGDATGDWHGPTAEAGVSYDASNGGQGGEFHGGAATGDWHGPAGYGDRSYGGDRGGGWGGGYHGGGDHGGGWGGGYRGGGGHGHR